MKLDQVLPLFAEPIALFTLKMDSQDVLKEIKSLKFIPRVSDYSNAHDKYNYGSESFDILSKGPHLKCLEAAITNACEHFIKEIGEYKTDFRITNSWATKVKPGGYAARHYHANSWLSGIYYPIGDPSFAVRFHSPRKTAYDFQPLKFNVFNSMAWTCVAKDNLLILFNSILDHEILTNQSKSTRYSIAFNVLPKGTIGKGDGHVKF